jgi:hypothetical protein
MAALSKTKIASVDVTIGQALYSILPALRI